ncbi:MAG: methyltransferase, partial [Pseudomonadota bacterium]
MQQLDQKTIYAAFAERRIEYGPAFRAVETIEHGANQAHGQLADGLDPEWIWIDGGLQVAGALVASEATMVPASVAAFERCSGESPRTVEARRRDGKLDVRWLDASGTVVARLSGLTLQPLRRMDGAARDADAYNTLHAVRWIEAPARRPLHRPADVLDDCAADFAVRLQDAAVERYLSALPHLDALALAWTARALPRDANELTDARLATELGVSDKHYRQLTRLRLALNGTRTTPQASRQEHREHDQAIAAETQWLTEHCQEASAETALINAVGAALPELLRGERDVLAVLFDDGGMDRLTALYGASPGAVAMNALLGDIVSRAQQDSAAPLRILELGAGTGATTEVLLTALQTCGIAVDYTFSDVSQRFLTGAARRFASFSSDRCRLRFEHCDIERPPSAQQLRRPFDIVVAANVAHAVADVETTLRYARELLAPGGLLALLETTRPLVWLDLIFGFTDGWWKHSDTARRAEHALLPAADWVDACQAAGFEHVALPAQDDLPQTVVLAQAPAPALTSWQLLGAPDDTARLAAALTRAGVAPARIQASPEPPDADDAERIVCLLPGSNREDAAEAAMAAGRQALHLVQRVLANASDEHPAARVEFVTGSTSVDQLAAAPLRGVLRSAALEHPAAHIGLLTADDPDALAQELIACSADREIWLDEGCRRTAGLIALPIADPTPYAGPRPATPMHLTHPTPGRLDTLCWQPAIDAPATSDPAATSEAPATPPAPGPGEVEIAVDASGLNFRDVLVALGTYPE